MTTRKLPEGLFGGYYDIIAREFVSVEVTDTQEVVTKTPKETEQEPAVETYSARLCNYEERPLKKKEAYLRGRQQEDEYVRMDRSNRFPLKSNEPRCRICHRNMSGTKCSMVCLKSFYFNAGRRSDQTGCGKRYGCNRCKYKDSCHYLHYPHFVGMKVEIHYFDMDYSSIYLEATIKEDYFAERNCFAVYIENSEGITWDCPVTFDCLNEREKLFLIPAFHIVKFESGPSL